MAAMFCPIECAHNDIYDGIDLFAVTVRHENGHFADYDTMWVMPHGRYVPALDNDPNPNPNPGTLNGDLVPDALEGFGKKYPQFDPQLWDSDLDNHVDFEDLGYDRECSQWTKTLGDTADWSNPGRQY